MDHFTYHNGVLCAEKVPLSDIAKKVGTPFYCYSTATLVHHYRVFKEAFSAVPTTICFAVKANSNQAVLKTLGDEGAGADCVSWGEILRARAAGINAKKIVFSGVGKTREELSKALEEGVGQINVESRDELIMLNEEAERLKKKAPIALRVNPDVEAGTHDKISTGRKTDKFGIAYEDAETMYAEAVTLKGIEVIAISTHIGSQLLDLEPFKKAFTKIAELVERLKKNGVPIKRVDLGGGLGVPYHNEMEPPAPKHYADMVIDTIKHLGCDLVLEPGRVIAGNAGVLVTRVVLVKHANERIFLVVDAAMNDLMRPSLYDAHHDIVAVDEAKQKGTHTLMDVVGPVCETADVFARNRKLPELEEDDLLALRTAGAYGAVMSGTYNTRPLIPEVLVSGDTFAVIRKRPTLDALIKQDILPSWLS
jgi:diaminopimelate decarboxylase